MHVRYVLQNTTLADVPTGTGRHFNPTHNFKTAIKCFHVDSIGTTSETRRMHMQHGSSDGVGAIAYLAAQPLIDTSRMMKNAYVAAAELLMVRRVRRREVEECDC